MKTLTVSLLLGVLAVALTGCPAPLCLNPEPSYTFPVTARFTPERDSIRVGDTLFLYSEFPSIMVPQGEQDSVIYTNSTGIGNTLGIVELIDGQKIAQGAVSNFKYLNEKGYIYNSDNIPNPNKFQQLKYEETGNKYILKVGLIPQKTGVYLLGIGNGLSNGRRSNNCEKASFQTRLTNQNPNSTYYEKWLGVPMENASKGISYIIKVY